MRRLLLVAVIVLAGFIPARRAQAQQVADVFTFINDWFSGDGENADWNRSGQLSVQDIFDFLNWWFAAPVNAAPPINNLNDFVHFMDTAEPTGRQWSPFIYKKYFPVWYAQWRALFLGDCPGDGSVDCNPVFVCNPYPGSSFGKALVFPPQGAMDFSVNPPVYRTPQEVCIYNLGTYDQWGVRTGSNGGYLNGRFMSTYVTRQGGSYPAITRSNAANNDFSVNYLGDTTTPAYQAISSASEVGMMYHTGQYRQQLMNIPFVQSLHLPLALEENFTKRQYRPDLVGLQAGVTGTFANFLEYLYLDTFYVFPTSNALGPSFRTRGNSYASLPPLSYAFDSELLIHEYAGLMLWWIVGDPRGPLADQYASGDFTKVASALKDGIGAFEGYRYSGQSEGIRTAYYYRRTSSGTPCDGTNIPCGKGTNIRNVMMFNEQDTSANGVYPFSYPSGWNTYWGPGADDVPGLFLAAVFYDISHEAGLGDEKAAMLFWKSISLVTDCTNMTMRQYGATILQAARLLWPSTTPITTQTPPASPGMLSIYEGVIADVLTSRGIPVYGVTDFNLNLPAAVGPVSPTNTRNFGSLHPDSQPPVNNYGSLVQYTKTFTQPGPPAAYVAYQFYKHSKYGPCDKLELTDGTFNSTPQYNNDGTFYWEVGDRDLENLVLLAPGQTLAFSDQRYRCPNEATGYYVEDVRPFGFICIGAVSNGFSFTVQEGTGSTTTAKDYLLTIVDPSQVAGDVYAWTFTDYLGNPTTATGTTAEYLALRDEPLTISITRTRGGTPTTLTIQDRGNDLDRNGGQAFVKNFVP